MYKTLTGYLRSVTDGSYYMDMENGDVKIINIPETVTPPPINKLIALSAAETSDGSWTTAYSIPNYSLVVRDA